MRNIKEVCWKPTNLNKELSPFTGMTRRHWFDCAKYILGRAFERYASDIGTLMEFPKVAGKSYPQPGSPEWSYHAAKLESIRRTSYLGFPVIHVDRDVILNSFKLRDYYKIHILRLLTHNSPDRIPYPEELNGGHRSYQFTCELGGLCMEMLCFPDVVWPDMNQQEKDAIAGTISKWAHHNTLTHNWRYFNVCMLTFLKINGYKIDEKLLKLHMHHLLSLYSGNGWALDGHYDYYSIYVINVYGAIWNRAYGYEHEPEIAACIENEIVSMLETYPALFGRDGYIPMWARSIIYRMSAIAGFPLAYFINKKIDFNPGWARRISSGALLQFAGREDFYYNDIPSLGYYGYREYCIQSYSSAGSPFTMFISHIALALDEDCPYWLAVENEGDWGTFDKSSNVTEISGPGIVSVRYGKTGTSELHTGKVSGNDQNYNKLCYNSHFPWEDEDLDNASAMQYVLRDKRVEIPDNSDNITDVVKTQNLTPEKMYYIGIKDSVIYRQIIFKDKFLAGRGYTIDLAEITLPNGIIRIDRCRLGYEYDLVLGHFGLPHIDNKPPEMNRIKVEGYSCITGAVEDRQLAFITINGWDGLDYISHTGKNAESDESTVIFADRKCDSYNETDIDLLISIILHKTDNIPWTAEELMPLKSFKIHEIMPNYSVFGAEIELKNGKTYSIDFKDIDGKRC